MDEKKLVGKEIEFEVIGNKGKVMRQARIVEIGFHEGLGKTMFTAITPLDNVVKLTRDEITRFKDENGDEIKVL